MSGALGISTRWRDRGSRTTDKHLILCLRCSVDSFQANTGAKGNCGSMIRAVNEELLSKGDVLEVSGPEE
jgi:hypothetical protein